MADSQPTTDYARGLQDAAKLCADAADRICGGRKRANQIDQHTADVLRSVATRILSLVEKAEPRLGSNYQQSIIAKANS